MNYYPLSRRGRPEPAAILAAIPRVDRDPCPRCGTRGDLECGHARLSRPLSNVIFA